MRLLITSTSFIDNVGAHQDLLHKLNFKVSTMRGPLKEAQLLSIIDNFDAILCGDDEFTKKVLEKGVKGRLKVLSKYGVGLDKIDLKASRTLGICVRNCPGLNQKSVAEHVFALLLSYSRNISFSFDTVRAYDWERRTGIQLAGKVLGIIGLGNIGKEVALLAKAFSMQILVFDKEPDNRFITKVGINAVHSLEDLAHKSNIITLHLSLNDSTYRIINQKLLGVMKNVILINTSRGGLVDENAIITALNKEGLKAYLADVLEVEPITRDNKLVSHPRVFLTPHTASRTYENVERQGTMALNNLVDEIKKYE